MRLVIGFVAFLLLTVSRPICAEEILTIHKVEGETDAKGSTVTVRFSGKVPWEAPTLEDHGGFLQLSLPKSITPESGVFLDGSGAYIDKMAVFQTTATDAALRLFVNKQAGTLKQAMSADILEDRLILNLDYSKLEGLGLKDHLAAPNASDVVAPAEGLKKDLVETAPREMTNAEKVLTLGKPDSDLKGKLGAVATFSFIMIAGLLFFHTARRLFRSKKGEPYKETVASIKTLATHSLAPKHRLTLVQVGGEQILLGVSPDGISFLTTIGREKREALPPAFSLPQAPVATLRNSYPPPPLSRPETAAPRKKKTETPAEPKAEAPKSSFAFAIDDEGVKTLDTARVPGPQGSMAQKSIEDVTNLIRRKLRNLPNV